MTHTALVQVAESWLRGTRRCGIVLTETGLIGGEVPDAIGWGKVSIVVECKVSRADFFADLRKPHRATPGAFGRERWYLTTPGRLGTTHVPTPWGLLEWTGRIVRRCRVAHVLDHDIDRQARELRLALGELRKYHAQGIRYRTLRPGGGYNDDGALGSLGVTS